MKIPSQPREDPASELNKSHTAGHQANPQQAPLPPALAIALVGELGGILEKALSKHPCGPAQQGGSDTQSRGDGGRCEGGLAPQSFCLLNYP